MKKKTQCSSVQLCYPFRKLSLTKKNSMKLFNTLLFLLTERQQEIMQGIVDGLSYKMIADRLDISIDTMRTHIMHIYRLLNINSKGELIRRSLEGEVL